MPALTGEHSQTSSITIPSDPTPEPNDHGCSAADTIRILIATDSHVGYNERDAIRGDDSWKSFHEVMCLAKDRDVDMVLLAGDLFHENKPSRKSMFQVMRSMRMNCLGERPCELEMLSDGSETFQGAFNHVNYEDPDINIAIPVFSIHGNHDDPTGEGHLAALDLLQTAGLINYYGRTPESDNIDVKPVLLQKGNTKLALYGMSNVRDERLFRTFRDQKVKFYRPGVQKDDWFNLMSVHQNHHAYTEKGYLPEEFLPSFLNFVVWGHEHECKIDPRYNPEMDFHVMQPGSSVATSLAVGEAVTKHVAILSVTGKDFKSENIRLKTVRPFVMKEIVLADDKEAKKIIKSPTNRTQVTQYLIKIVDQLVEQANQEWREAQDEPEEDDDEVEPPLPLVRLRVEFTAPGGGAYDCENPQRFSNRFVGKVANVNDVIQYHRKKKSATRQKDRADMPEGSVLAELSAERGIQVHKIVEEFLDAQSLTILPQNSFGHAVAEFVNKDDNHCMETFVMDSLEKQVGFLFNEEYGDDGEVAERMEEYKNKLEEMFASGQLKLRKAKLKPQPEDYDEETLGPWEDQPAAIDRSDVEDNQNGEEGEDGEPVAKPKKGRGKAAAPKKTAAASKKAAPAKTTGRGKKKVVEASEEEEEDILMVDDDDDENELFVKQAPAKSTRKPPARKVASPAPARRTAARPAAKPAPTQSQLNFSQPARQTNGKKVYEISDDISDEDDAFEPASTAKSTRSRR